jgi:cardiolipin synthase
VNTLLDAVLRLVAETPPDRVEQLARAVTNSGGVAVASHLDDWPLNASARSLLTALVGAWRLHPIGSAELAALIVGAGAGYRRSKSGILIRGGSVPRDLHRHLEALETSNVIARV